MHKKGQAAMEFLMTYGWAILAAIIAIGVLAYFGVFSPGKLVAAAATVNAPFGISAHNVLNTGTTDGTVNLDMVQNSGGTITNVIVTVTGTGAMSGVTCTSAAVASWNTGTSQSVALDCTDGVATDPLTAGQSFAGEITVTYNQQGSALDLRTTGSIRDTVQ